MKTKKHTLLPLAALAGLALTASANAVVIVNPSFEVDAVDNGAFISTATGWDVVGDPTGTQDFDTDSPTATDGEQHGFASFVNASLSQLTPYIITAGETYTLTVDVGQVDAFSGSQATISLFGSTAGIGTALTNINGTADAVIAPGSGAYLLNQTVSYTAVAGDAFEGQQIGIALVNTAGTQTLFDNVRLDITPVPEPSSLALLGLSGLGLLVRRRRA